MNRNVYVAVAVALLVALAGCGGSPGTDGGDAGTATPTDGAMTDGETTTTDGEAAANGEETTTTDTGDGTTTEQGTEGDGTTTGVGETETATGTSDQANATVSIADQTSDGTTVVVEQVVLPEGGYVVIHRAAGDEGTAGEVIGASDYLEPGSHENVEVELDDPMSDSGELVAMAHLDTNDNQFFEFPDSDGPYTQDGEPVVDSAQVTVEGQTTETGTETGTETDTETGTETATPTG